MEELGVEGGDETPCSGGKRVMDRGKVGESNFGKGIGNGGGEGKARAAAIAWGAQGDP